jgi:hypothetical protein
MTGHKMFTSPRSSDSGDVASVALTDRWPGMVEQVAATRALGEHPKRVFASSGAA